MKVLAHQVCQVGLSFRVQHRCVPFVAVIQVAVICLACEVGSSVVVQVELQAVCPSQLVVPLALVMAVVKVHVPVVHVRQRSCQVAV